MGIEVMRSAPGKRQRFLLRLCACLCPLLAAGCATPGFRVAHYGPQPVAGPLTTTAQSLEDLRPPPRPITVAVYDFPDLTGQRKPGGVVADLSTAVTQGASSLVIEALKSAGGGGWFDVVDRTRDADQARERSIRLAAETNDGKKPAPVMVPLRPADYILNGGIITYERSIESGDATADWLGLGGGADTNRNFVSVTMRLVNAETAEVVQSVTVHKSIDSVTAGIFSRNRAAPYGEYPQSLLDIYPSLSDALDANFSRTVGELTEIALREAIETAIRDLIIKCKADGVWSVRRIAAHDPVPLPAPRPRSDAAALSPPAEGNGRGKQVGSARPHEIKNTLTLNMAGAEFAYLDKGAAPPHSTDGHFGGALSSAMRLDALQ